MPPSPTRPRKTLVTAVVIFLVVSCMALYITRETGWWGGHLNGSREMHPTIQHGDLVLTTNFRGGINSVERGWIVKYTHLPYIPKDSNQWLMGRIAAKPGDTVSFQDGVILINGVKYGAGGGPAKAPAPPPVKDTYPRLAFPLVVPDNHVFILGDNPRNVLDSRSLGPIRIGAIHQRVIYHPDNPQSSR